MQSFLERTLEGPRGPFGGNREPLWGVRWQISPGRDLLLLLFYPDLFARCSEILCSGPPRALHLVGKPASTQVNRLL